MAAFCEVMRIIRMRVKATPPLAAAEALGMAQRFHRTLVLELIDDSDGLHTFGEAHLEEFFGVIKNQAVLPDHRATVQERLKAFEDAYGEY